MPASMNVVLLIACVALAGSGCSSMTQELEQEEAATAQITTRIKAALVEADEVSAAAIGIAMEENTIVLTGFVGDAQEAEAAERIAREAAPEQQVQNRIEVQ